MSWTPADSNEDNFDVLREVGGVEETIDTLDAGTTTYVDDDVEPDTGYIYRIRAYNVNGESFSSPVNLTTDSQPSNSTYYSESETNSYGLVFGTFEDTQDNEFI